MSVLLCQVVTLEMHSSFHDILIMWLYITYLEYELQIYKGIC